MALRYRTRLLAHLQHRDYTPRTISELALDLNIEDRKDFSGAIDELVREGVIEVTDGGNVRLPSVASGGGEIEGTFKRDSDSSRRMTRHARAICSFRPTRRVMR
jgi:predicted MarR family transcription regulator